MVKKSIGSAVLCLAFGSLAVMAQTAVKPSLVPGDVVSIADKKIVVKSKTGDVDVTVTDKTEFKRVSAANPNLQTATSAVMTDIAVGDSVIVTGIMAADGKSIPARSVYLMTKSDITQKRTSEADAWRTRGIAGKVTTVNPQTNQLTVEVRGLAASTSVMVTPKENALFKRYTSDSVRYDEAKVSSLAEIKPGDMIRALGDKSTDGTAFSAEQVVTGAFQTIAGTVKTIDATKNEIVITDLQTKKDVTVVISGTSVLKRFPSEMAERMAGMQTFGGGGARPVGARARPAGTPAAGQRGMGGQGMGGGQGAQGGLDDMLERLPNITSADLKAGDMIAISSTKSDTADRVKAIKLVAGVEPFLRMAQAAGGRRGQGGVEAGFSIPGLDSIGIP